MALKKQNFAVLMAASILLSNLQPWTLLAPAADTDGAAYDGIEEVFPEEEEYDYATEAFDPLLPLTEEGEVADETYEDELLFDGDPEISVIEEVMETDPAFDLLDEISAEVPLQNTGNNPTETFTVGNADDYLLDAEYAYTGSFEISLPSYAEAYRATDEDMSDLIEDNGEIEEAEEHITDQYGFYNHYGDQYSLFRTHIDRTKIYQHFYSVCEKMLKDIKCGTTVNDYGSDELFSVVYEINDLEAYRWLNYSETYKNDLAYQISYPQVRAFLYDVLNEVMCAISYDNPEYYWMRDVYFDWDVFCNVYTDSSSGRRYLELYVGKTYLTPSEFFPGAIAGQKNSVSTFAGIYNKILSLPTTDINTDKTVSDYEFLLAAHDFLRDNLYYDYALLKVAEHAESQDLSYRIYTPEPLTSGSNGIVCEGYARAFKYLCDLKKIPCILLRSHKHMWNAVKLKNKWYNVDVTWDDTGDDPYEYFLAGRLEDEAHDVKTFEINSNFALPNIENKTYQEAPGEHFYENDFSYTEILKHNCERRKVTVKTCKTCGDTIYVNGPIYYKHNYEVISQKEYTGDGPCLAYWVTKRKCSDCNAVITEKTNQVIAEGKPHTYGKWVIAKKATYTSTGSQKRTCKYCGSSQTQKIAALDPRLKVTSPSSKNVTIKKGKTFSLKASSKTTISYTSSNTKVATVSKKGIITGVKKGTAKITISSGTKKATIAVTIN